jgi:DUF4097 and DUF4098 domain-containing protein YvlB
MIRTRLVFALASALAAPAALASIPFDETRPLNADAAVSLDNLQGRIEVSIWDRNEIRIEGQRADSTEGLSIEGDASDLSVEIEYPESRGWFGGWGRGGGDSDLRVTLPAGVALDIDTVSAEVQVRGVAGRELVIDSVSGDVLVHSGAKSVEIDNVSGDIVVEMQAGDVAAESVSGDIEVRGAMDGRIQAEAVSGSILIESAAAARQVNAGVVSGDVHLRVGLQPGGRIQAESLSGDLELLLPAGTSAKLSASSFTGTIRSDHGTVDTEEHGPGSSLSTTLGSGEGRIDLETFSGDLTVRDR